MARFMGTHTNRLDRKGRVSVPALFRAELARLGSDEIVLRPSHQYACIEAWPMPEFDAMASKLDRLDVFSADQEDLATAIFADAYPLRPDGEGRIMLPEDLIGHAGLSETVAFVGMGIKFALWEPAAAKQRALAARSGTRDRSLTLPGGGLAARTPTGGSA